MIDRHAEIVFNRPVTRDTWMMKLRSPELAGETKPGQFVMLKVRPGIDPLLRRPFSVCGVDEERVMILYRIVGKGTEIMTAGEEGEHLPVLGPLGTGFSMPGENDYPVLVGGGIGVAPLFLLAQFLMTRDLTFMVGFRTSREILRPEAIGRSHTLALATDDGTEGHSGFVTDLLPPFLEKNRGRSLTLFACGPRPMLKKVAETARVHGVPCQVSLESSMACGFGVCQGCAVKAPSDASRAYHYVCQNGPVFKVDHVDWSRL